MKTTLNIDEAAELMQIHAKTVLDLIANGTLPAGKIGRAYVLLSKDVMHHIEAVIVRQTAERMGGQPRRRGRLPELVGKIRAPQVRVTHQHAV
jgi:excisionase family DNA binding protein